MLDFLRDCLGYILLIVAIILMVRIFTLPIRLIFRFLWNGLLGLILLILFNTVGGLIGVTIGINFLSCITVGILGVPGLILLLLIRWLSML